MEKQSLIPQTHIDRLSQDDQDFLDFLKEDFRFSQQQLKKTSNYLLDCKMWREDSFWVSIEESLNQLAENFTHLNSVQKRDWLFHKIQESYNSILNTLREYPAKAIKEFQPKYTFKDKELVGNIFRLCPAASERAVCCNLKVLNVVDNCAMGCSYCVLQNHYDTAEIKIPTNLREKLMELNLRSDKRYRIGTGEYSDSLFWGNKNGILDHLSEFAHNHQNVILELKTKSAKISYLLKNDLPPNLIASWSLNPKTIVTHEEQGTATLLKRLESARRVADKGVKVAFHIHPMMYYKGWEEEYQALVQMVLERFTPAEVLWVSLGCVTMMKGFAQKMRTSYEGSKLLQMPTEKTPDGKITYSFEIREKLYTNVLQALKPWEGKVFQYLCMEHKPMWDKVMPYTYTSMGEFDDTFSDSAFAKLTTLTNQD